MNALCQVSADSSATTLTELVGEIEAAVDALLAVMPAYAPPLNVLHRLMSLVDAAVERQNSVASLRAAITSEAARYQEWSQQARARIGQHAVNRIPDGCTLFTFTLSETIAFTLTTAHQQGKTFHVIVTESRPNNDGRETVRILSEAGIPVSISIDACIGELIPQADIMMVGAEAIMADGSAVCKVGTYPAALVAQVHGVPVYVVVDTMKFNISSLLGISLLLDGISLGAFPVDPSITPGEVVGHLFDTTPPELIAGIITELGVISPFACGQVLTALSFSRSLSQKLAVWAAGGRAH
jgi:translation initiation factor 2B subunit (eIF-2B alpha/beta/delta family)